MSTLSPDRWKAASPYLDQALEMPVEARADWLEAIRRRTHLWRRTWKRCSQSIR